MMTVRKFCQRIYDIRVTMVSSGSKIQSITVVQVFFVVICTPKMCWFMRQMSVCVVYHEFRGEDDFIRTYPYKFGD